MNNKKTILLIMDGWGHGNKRKADAIANAGTPNVSSYYHLYPNSELVTSGNEVGLPQGQMGNSEVGHLNLGAGRIVYQELQRINVAIESGALSKNTTLNAAFKYARDNHKKLHFIGLIGEGGVHAHSNHLKALTQYAYQYGIVQYAVHAFTDGRDTDPKSGYEYLKDIKKHLKNNGGQLASVCGRYFAMDRDKRWERVKVAYDAMVNGIGTKTNDPLQAIQNSYDNNITDEFLQPLICVDEQQEPVALIQKDDVVICFNFRTDRCREITEVLTQNDYNELGMQKIPLHYITMTQYDHNFKNVEALFHNEDLTNTLGEVLSHHGKKQIRIAETEKYPHVTFFFSGGREVPFDQEIRLMAASPKDVATYDLKPEMSADEITRLILPEIAKQSADFICLNFANADMVGHTGVWEAAIKAVEKVDSCVGQIVNAALQSNYTIFLTADHGNSDYLINDDESPNTAHTTNPVPLFIISNDYKGNLKNGKLGDVAPTILNYMQLEIPKEMTGNILTDA